MDHRIFLSFFSPSKKPVRKKAPHGSNAHAALFHEWKLLAKGMVHLAIAAGEDLVFLIGAALIGNSAAGLAGALAGALALAAATVGQGLTQAGLRNGLNMLHNDCSLHEIR
jgi:hypothetical protein